MTKNSATRPGLSQSQRENNTAGGGGGRKEAGQGNGKKSREEAGEGSSFWVGFVFFEPERRDAVTAVAGRFLRGAPARAEFPRPPSSFRPAVRRRPPPLGGAWGLVALRGRWQRRFSERHFSTLSDGRQRCQAAHREGAHRPGELQHGRRRAPAQAAARGGGGGPDRPAAPPGRVPAPSSRPRPWGWAGPELGRAEAAAVRAPLGATPAPRSQASGSHDDEEEEV